MPPEPLHRPRFSRQPERPRKPDRLARAVGATRLGAVLAAVVAVLTLFLGPGRFPFDPQYLVIVAFLAPIVVALVRPPD